MVSELRYVFYHHINHAYQLIAISDTIAVQIHMLEDGQIVVFSRNSENMSAKYPDLVESIPRVSRY